MADLSRTPVTLIGASRSLGRVLAETFHRLGAQVLVVARGQADFPEVDWDEFSDNWNNDVRMSFHFLQASLERPLPSGAIYTRRGDGPYLPHSLHVLAGKGQVGELVLYAPPLGASLFAAFGLSPVD